jgi:hypothetical protein
MSPAPFGTTVLVLHSWLRTFGLGSPCCCRESNPSLLAFSTFWEEHKCSVRRLAPPAVSTALPLLVLLPVGVDALHTDKRWTLREVLRLGVRVVQPREARNEMSRRRVSGR